MEKTPARGLALAGRGGSKMANSKRSRAGLLSVTLAAALAVALAACVGNPNVSSPWLAPAGSSLAFQDGFVDGCRTGYADAGRDGMELAGRKDGPRYGREADYKAGFDNAYHGCFEDEKLHPKMRGGDGSGRNG
jgi:hypothetical protein